MFPFCGGVLVVVNNTLVVLTAGCCVRFETIDGFTLVAGEVNPYEESCFEQYRKVTISSNNDSYFSDIGLVIQYQTNLLSLTTR